MTSVKAILRATEYVSVRRVPHPESEDSLNQTSEIGTMGVETLRPERVDATIVSIPQSKPAARAATPRNAHRRLWRITLRATAITFAMFVIAFGTLFGWAAYDAWRSEKAREWFDRQPSLYQQEMMREERLHQHSNGGER